MKLGGNTISNFSNFFHSDYFFHVSVCPIYAGKYSVGKTVLRVLFISNFFYLSDFWFR